jgi:hypothetical protein
MASREVTPRTSGTFLKVEKIGRTRGISLNAWNTFILGALVGIGVSGTVYFLFTYVISEFSDLFISGVTLLGFGFAIGGYVANWKGDRSLTNYFILGLGIGILVVGFLGAGNATSPIF